MAAKDDVVRSVLTVLVNETESSYTPEQILRIFLHTADKRVSSEKLLAILGDISRKRTNSFNVLNNIVELLVNKDPFYALLEFVDQIVKDPSWPVKAAVMQTNGTDTVRCLIDSDGASADSALPTSTPLTSRRSEESLSLALPSSSSSSLLSRRTMGKMSSTGDSGFKCSSASTSHLSEIKQRVVDAVTSGYISGSRTSSSRLALKSSVSSVLSVNSNTFLTARSISQMSIPSCSSYFSVAPISTPYSGRSGNSELTDPACTIGVNLTCHRTNALWNFQKVEHEEPETDLSALPLESQERIILTELLYTLTGLQGTHIKPYLDPLKPNQTCFTVNTNLEKSLAEVVQEILPLASDFNEIQKFMAYSEGSSQVTNALIAALDEVDEDFYSLLSEVEQELLQDKLTAPKLLYYLQPTMWLMHDIASTLLEVQENQYVGADVLSHLCGRIKMLEGNKESQNYIIALTIKAAVPYMSLLQLWIQKGVIVDRTNEFLVEENSIDEKSNSCNLDYWEKRYTIRNNGIPIFLENYVDKILRTGKYINVVRQCRKRSMPTQAMDLQFDPTNEKHVDVINDAYHFASSMLLDVLLVDNDLMGHLQSVRRYLLLYQGDFIMEFMDACEDELSKNVDHVLPMTLENLLGLTLRLSSARCDPYKDDLHCELLTYDLVTQMSKIINKEEEYWKNTDRLDLTGLECFAFSYDVKWPVSLVINQMSISKYQMIFRQLFYCKHVERQLCKIWKRNSATKKFIPRSAELYRSAFTLRQRMMNAIQNLGYYMMIEIIEPNWHILSEKINKVENVDMVLHLHQDFLDLCLKNCMLTESSNMNRAIFKLCNICLQFCDFIQRSQRLYIDAELKSMVYDSNDESTDQSDSEPENLEMQLESSLDKSETFAERVKRFDLEFTCVLISFLKQIKEMAKNNGFDRFMNLVHRINFNGYYSEQMEKICVKNAMGNN